MYYHVIISVRGAYQDIVRLDLREQQLEDMILAPYHNGTQLKVQGKTIPLEEITGLTITRTAESSGNIEQKRDIVESIKLRTNLYQSERSRIAESGEDVTDEFISVPPGTNKALIEKEEVKNLVDKKKVFVVHGRDEQSRKSLYNFLRAINLDPIEWPEAVRYTGEGSPYVGKALRIIESAKAIVVLLTPDDLAQLRRDLWKKNEPESEKALLGQPRPNVLIELGMALGVNEPGTIIVQVGKIKEISDIKGRHILYLDNTAPAKNQLVNRLKTAGCDVKTEGDDWLEAGDFSPPVIDKTPEIVAPPNDYIPTVMDEKLMVVIAKHYDDGRTVDDLSEVFSIGKQKLKLTLDNLESHGLVDCSRSSITRWGAYFLTNKARELLDERGLL